MQIVDLYQARQHLWELVRKLYPNDEAKQKAWMKIHQKRLLHKGKIEKLVDAISARNRTRAMGPPAHAYAAKGQTRSMLLLSIHALSSAFKNFMSSRTTVSACR